MVLEHRGAFAVLPCRRLLDDARTGTACAGERCIDVRNSHLEDVGHAATRHNLFVSDVGHDDCATESASSAWVSTRSTCCT